MKNSRRESYRAYYYTHRDEIRARRAKRIDITRTYNKRYYAMNREKLKSKRAKYDAAHPEERAKYYLKHRIGIEPTAELVKVKGLQIALVREIRKVKEALHG